jgi:hypothetical protein
LYCFLSSSIEDVLFTIVVEGGMLSSLPKLVQPVPLGGLDRESWTIEFSRQRIDTDWYIWTRFRNVPHICSVMDHNSSRRKSGSPYQSLQTFPAEQNSSGVVR